MQVMNNVNSHEGFLPLDHLRGQERHLLVFSAELVGGDFYHHGVWWRRLRWWQKFKVWFFFVTRRLVFGGLGARILLFLILFLILFLFLFLFLASKGLQRGFGGVFKNSVW